MKGQMERQRASVPAFGGWDDMAAAAGGGAGALPDYSLDFSKIRTARMQRRKALSWSSGAGAGTGQEKQSSTAAGSGSEDHERRRRHRRQHSDATEARQPIHAPPKEGRSKFKGYFFGCMGRWYVGQH